MAGYPVFSAPGPTVDVRLFGEAAETGAKIGKEIPSDLTAITNGAVQGYQQGQQIELNNANINKAQAQAQIAQSSATIQTSTQDAQILATKDSLQLQAAQSSQQAQDLSAKSTFIDQYSQADLDTKGKLLTNGNPIFLENPALYKEALQQYSTALPPGDPRLPQINRLLGHSNIDEYYNHQAFQNQETFKKSAADAFQGAGANLTSDIMQKLNVPQELAPSSVELVDAGKYEVDPDTNRIKLDNSGERIQRSALVRSTDPKTVLGHFMAISTRPDSKGLVISQDIDSQAAGTYKKYLSNQSLANGTQASNAKSIFDQNLQSAQGGNKSIQSNTNVPSFNDRNTSPAFAPSPATSPEDAFRSDIKKNLNLSDADVSAATPSLDKLHQLAGGYVSNVKNRNDPNYTKQLGETIKTTARQISDNQFKNDPAAQSQYTASNVAAYNSTIDGIADQIDPDGQYGLREQLGSKKVLTPQDLYYSVYGNLIYNKLFDYTIKANSAALQNDANKATRSLAIESINKSLSSKAAGNG